MGLSGNLGASLDKCQEETPHGASHEEEGGDGKRGGDGGGGVLGQYHD